MRIGIVCPYSFDVPGGVQFHVRDLAERLQDLKHNVSVLAPAAEHTPVPEYVVSGGRTVAVPYNGSVARLSFGPIAANRTRKWLADNDFDVLHLHEPAIPSLSMLALWVAQGPVVGTFHSSMNRSRALHVASPLLRPQLEKLTARIAVSEEARRTLVEHLGGDAVVVPNGVFVDDFATAEPAPAWVGGPQAPTVAFLGRLDEPRKGLGVLLGAVDTVAQRIPGVRFLVAGRGETTFDHPNVSFLGGLSEIEKRALLASVDLYVAPQTGGESFGIVLVEAMSGGAHVVASDLPAFDAVLASGRYGTLFPRGDSQALAGALLEVLADREASGRLRAEAAQGVRRYDWSVVTEEVLAVYDMAIGSVAAPVQEDPAVRTALGRLRAGFDGKGRQ